MDAAVAVPPPAPPAVENIVSRGKGMMHASSPEQEMKCHWAIRDQLMLSHAVLRYGVNWNVVCRALKLGVQPNLARDLTSQQCAYQYTMFIEAMEVPKRKKGRYLFATADRIARQLKVRRIEELKSKIEETTRRFSETIHLLRTLILPHEPPLKSEPLNCFEKCMRFINEEGSTREAESKLAERNYDSSFIDITSEEEEEDGLSEIPNRIPDFIASQAEAICFQVVVDILIAMALEQTILSLTAEQTVYCSNMAAMDKKRGFGYDFTPHIYSTFPSRIKPPALHQLLYFEDLKSKEKNRYETRMAPSFDEEENKVVAFNASKEEDELRITAQTESASDVENEETNVSDEGSQLQLSNSSFDESFLRFKDSKDSAFLESRPSSQQSLKSEELGQPMPYNNASKHIQMKEPTMDDERCYLTHRKAQIEDCKRLSSPNKIMGIYLDQKALMELLSPLPNGNLSLRKPLLMLWRYTVEHRYARMLERPHRSDSYLRVVRKPTTLTNIKQQIKSGHIGSIREFKQSLLRLFFNAIMLDRHNSGSSSHHHHIVQMQKDILEQIQALEHLLKKCTFDKIQGIRKTKSKKVN